MSPKSALVCVDRINEAHRSARRDVVSAINHAIECGRLLLQAKESVAHGEWQRWISNNCDFGASAARRMMAAAKRALAHDLTEDDALAISREMWGKRRPALYSSQSVEWYTPAEYIDAVRAVLGQIDLDPASCEQANHTVGATRIFTEADDGLSRDWFGRVFLNPPYGMQGKESLAGLFCRKAIDELQKQNIDACIILVNAVHSQEWQRPLYKFPVCLVDHRIKFVSGDGAPNQNPTYQNAFFYLGTDFDAFAREFADSGFVLVSPYSRFLRAESRATQCVQKK